jgi:hypothetical protein
MKSNVRSDQVIKAKNFHSKTPAKSPRHRKFKAIDKEQSKIDEEYDKFLEEWEQDTMFSIHA